MIPKHASMRALAVLLALAAGLCFAPAGAGAEAEGGAEARINALLGQMTLEEKICQLFFVRPEDFSRISSVTKGSAKLENAFAKFPVGGVVLFPGNIKSGEQLTELNEAMQSYAKKARGIGLLIGVDEEGGGVARVARKLKLKDAAPAMSVIGESGDPQRAYEIGVQIGAYLRGYGFTLDFAPVADVRTDVEKAEITLRSFGYDAALVSEMVSGFVRGIQEQQVLAVLKHFPGHGGASGNAHNGSAVSTRTVGQWRSFEWLPFEAGLEAGARVVMISHQTAAAVDGGQPATLSYRIVTELLRGELGFEGVAVTDALRMDAVAGTYGSGEACVRALLAGCDMLLLPKNFSNGYHGVLEAVADGRLSEERIDESVRRILKLKDAWGLLK